MARKINTFEGGTNGTAVTTGNTGGASGDAANQIVAGAGWTHRFSSAQAMHGSLSLEQVGGSGTQAYFAWTYTSVDRVYGRAYAYLTTAFQGRSLIQCRAAAAQTWRIALTSGGVVEFRNAANTLVDSSAALSLNTWYRIEFDVQQSTGNFTVLIYVGDGVTGGDLLDTLSGTGASLGTTDFDEIRFGQIANATGLNSLFFDGLDVNDVGLPGPWLQTVTPGGIASGEAFGTALITEYIVPGGIASGEAFGSPTVSQASGTQNISPSGIASAEAFGAALLTYVVAVSGIASGEAFGTATIGLAVVVSGIPSAEAFGSPTVSPGAVTVSPSGIASAETFGSPTVTTGAVSVAPTGIGSAEAFGTATLSTGPVSVVVSGIASGEAFGTAVVSAGGFVVQPSGVSSAEAFGSPTVTTGPVVVAPTGIGSAEAVGSPVVTLGLFVVEPSGIASAELFGGATVTVEGVGLPQVIAPSGIASAGTVRPPVVTVMAGSLCVCVDLEGMVPQFGTPVVTRMA